MSSPRFDGRVLLEVRRCYCRRGAQRRQLPRIATSESRIEISRGGRRERRGDRQDEKGERPPDQPVQACLQGVNGLSWPSTGPSNRRDALGHGQVCCERIRSSWTLAERVAPRGDGQLETIRLDPLAAFSTRSGTFFLHCTKRST